MVKLDEENNVVRCHHISFIFFGQKQNKKVYLISFWSIVFIIEHTGAESTKLNEPVNYEFVTTAKFWPKIYK